MRIAKYKFNSLAECPWPSTTVWTQGCNLHCSGCWNPDLWPPGGGFDVNINQWQRLLDKTGKALCFVGGEPTLQPDLPHFLLATRTLRPDLVVVVFTGLLWDDAIARVPALLSTTTYVVDGPFIQSLANDNLTYKGSANQRIIDVRKTILCGRVVEASWSKSMLIVLGKGQISGTPAVMEKVFSQDMQSSGCGKVNGHV